MILKQSTYKIKLLVTDVHKILQPVTSNSDDVKFQSNHKDTLSDEHHACIERTGALYTGVLL